MDRTKAVEVTSGDGGGIKSHGGTAIGALEFPCYKNKTNASGQHSIGNYLIETYSYKWYCMSKSLSTVCISHWVLYI